MSYSLQGQWAQTSNMQTIAEKFNTVIKLVHLHGISLSSD